MRDTIMYTYFWIPFSVLPVSLSSPFVTSPKSPPKFQMVWSVFSQSTVGTRYMMTGHYIQRLKCFLTAERNNEEWREREELSGVLLRKSCVAFSTSSWVLFSKCGFIIKNGDFQNIRMYYCSLFWIKQCHWQNTDHCLNLIQKDSNTSFIHFIKLQREGGLLSHHLRACKFGLLRSYVELKWRFHLFTRCLLNAVPRS